MDTTHPKFKQMMTLFSQTGKQGYRHTYAWEASTGRTESTKELTENEINIIIKQLQALNPTIKKYIPKPGDVQRKKIIAIARDMRWDVRGKDEMMQLIDKFMLNHTKYKKRLNSLTVDELNKVCHTFEHELKKSFLNGLNR